MTTPAAIEAVSCAPAFFSFSFSSAAAAAASALLEEVTTCVAPVWVPDETAVDVPLVVEGVVELEDEEVCSGLVETLLSRPDL